MDTRAESIGALNVRRVGALGLPGWHGNFLALFVSFLPGRSNSSEDLLFDPFDRPWS